MPDEIAAGPYELFITAQLLGEEMHPVLSRVGFSRIDEMTRTLKEIYREVSKDLISDDSLLVAGEPDEDLPIREIVPNIYSEDQAYVRGFLEWNQFARDVLSQLRLARFNAGIAAIQADALSDKQRKIVQERMRVVQQVPIWMPAGLEHIEPLVNEPLFVIRSELLVPPDSAPPSFTVESPEVELIIDSIGI